MTATTLKIVSPTDATVVLVDLNDATNTFLLADPDFGGAALEAAVSEPQNVSVGTTTFTRRSLSQMTLRIRIKGSSYDDLVTRVNLLAQYLSEGCVVQYIGYGSSVTRYIDVEPSQTPVLVDGRELALWQVAQLFDTPQGVTLTLTRQPFLRGSALDPSVNVLANSTLLRDSNDDGLPDSWTKTSTPTLTIASATDSLHAVCSATTQGIYQATGAASASSGQAWTLSADVKVASGTLALYMDWRTGADASISTSSGTSTASTWTRVTVSGTAPATTDHIRVRIESSGAAATFDVRNVQLEQAAAATDYRVKSETLTMDPALTSGFGRMVPIYNPAPAPSPVVITAAFPDASTAVTGLNLNLRSTDDIDGTGALADYMNATCAMQADATSRGWTLISDTSSTAGATSGASGGASARFALTTAWARLRSWTRTTRLDSLRGEHVVWAKVQAGTSSVFEFMVGWSGGTSAPATFRTEVVTHDTTLASTYGWVWVELGRIWLPWNTTSTLGGARLELWSRVQSSTGTLDVDCIELRPADSVAAITTSESSSTSTPPADMSATAGGVDSGDSIIIAGGSASTITSPTVGDAGYHVCSFTVRNSTDGAASIAFTVYNGSAVSQAAIIDELASGVSQTYSLQFNAAAGTWYTTLLVDASASSSRYFHVNSYTDTFIPTVAQTQRISCDPGSVPRRAIVEKQDGSGYYLAALDATVIPFWAPPGLSLVTVSAEDAAIAGYDEPTTTLARTVTLSATVHPRYWT